MFCPIMPDVVYGLWITLLFRSFFGATSLESKETHGQTRGIINS